MVDVGVSACLRCHPARCNRSKQPAAAIRKYPVHAQVEASLLTVIPLTRETMPVMPKKVPPTSTSIFALCHLSAWTADQQPKAMASNSAPKHLTPIPFAGHDHQDMTTGRQS